MLIPALQAPTASIASTHTLPQHSLHAALADARGTTPDEIQQIARKALGVESGAPAKLITAQIAAKTKDLRDDSLVIRLHILELVWCQTLTALDHDRPTAERVELVACCQNQAATSALNMFLCYLFLERCPLRTKVRLSVFLKLEICIQRSPECENATSNARNDAALTSGLLGQAHRSPAHPRKHASTNPICVLTKEIPEEPVTETERTGTLACTDHLHACIPFISDQRSCCVRNGERTRSPKFEIFTDPKYL